MYIQSHMFWSLDACERFDDVRSFFAKVPKIIYFSRHFRFYCNIVQNASKVSAIFKYIFQQLLTFNGSEKHFHEIFCFHIKDYAYLQSQFFQWQMSVTILLCSSLNLTSIRRRIFSYLERETSKNKKSYKKLLKKIDKKG